MGVEETVWQATCRVDSGGQQYGSCFWIDEHRLLTAAHVTAEIEEDNLTLRTSQGDQLSAEVILQDENLEDDPGTDIAVLETEETADEILELNGEIPSIGSEVVWSGYARLFGESKMDRQRFGWGRVASSSYGQDGEFFEVDGLFNPSHSGGPVVHRSSGQVVGVVSASAGGFGNLEEAWTDRISMLQELFSLQQGDGMLYRTFTYDDPEDAVRHRQFFRNVGMTAEMETNEEGKFEIQINTEEIPIAAGKIQAELGKLLLDTAQATFQMGVGIASGGKGLQVAET